MRLWGGASDTGCCSIADVDDARRVAPAARHRSPRVQLHRRLRRARRAAVRRRARCGHDAEPVHRVQPPPEVPPAQRARRPARLRRGRHRAPRAHRASTTADRFVARGADPAKDQSYVVHMLPPHELGAHPVPGRPPHQGRGAQQGHVGRSAHRRQARQPGRVLHHPHRWTHAVPRRPHPVPPGPCGRSATGAQVGEVDAVELVTVGQRRGIGLPGGGPKRYVVDVDVPRARGGGRRRRDLFDDVVRVDGCTWVADRARSATCWCSAARTATVRARVDRRRRRRVGTSRSAVSRPGRSVVVYDVGNERVLGGGIASRVLVEDLPQP